MRPILAGAVVAGLALLAGFALLLASPDRPTPEYPHSAPDQVLDAAVAMIGDDRPDLLPTLVDAPSPEFRGVLERVGGLLESLLDLSRALESEFPSEVASLRAAPPPGLLSGRAASNLDESTLTRLFADPFSWLVETRDRLETIPIGDNAAAILIDGAPAFGVGLTMKRSEDGLWRVVVPLGLPFVNRYLPQSRDEWSIVASMVTVVDNAVQDLTRDVRQGRCETLDDAVQRAGEKAWPPLAICYFAYTRAMETRASGAP